jgi:hypothetical protein
LARVIFSALPSDETFIRWLCFQFAASTCWSL